MHGEAWRSTPAETPLNVAEVSRLRLEALGLWTRLLDPLSSRAHALGPRLKVNPLNQLRHSPPLLLSHVVNVGDMKEMEAEKSQ